MKTVAEVKHILSEWIPLRLPSDKGYDDAKVRLGALASCLASRGLSFHCAAFTQAGVPGYCLAIEGDKLFAPFDIAAYANEDGSINISLIHTDKLWEEEDYWEKYTI
jgi:hypothetical protein